MAKKTLKVPVTIVTEMPRTFWMKVKDFFYHAESVLLAWVTGLVGSVTALVMGILASTDFSSIMQMFQSGIAFSKQQLMVMGIGALGMGFIQYWTRVRGTKEVDGRLLPKAD
jgi:uncharacterized membrane protein YadS